ncbi:uncharacterized protein ARMOST_09932 [Armillaria ostoyae]|uniref:SMODS and SLOG-associating 2TM effector domain-containing protein n=1 Tax=Armillaria ostoyae TaxID=47428 RepID=A0A284RCW6_ARMOS|nr:uncharacterized protein ARMOST_09932 [Armillaria ostoyae]
MSESPAKKARPLRADNPQIGAVPLSTRPYILAPTFPSPALPPTAVLSQSLSIATPNTENVPSLSTTPTPTKTTVIQPLPQSYSSGKNLSSSQPTPPSHNPLTKTTQTPGNVTKPSSASPVLSTILSPSTDTQHNSSASPSTTVSASTTSAAAIVSASTNTAHEGETSTPTDPIATTHINNTSRSVDSSNVLQMRRDRANRPVAPVPVLDWIVPHDPQVQTDTYTQVKTATERLRPTIVLAEEARKMYAERAMMNGYAMNVAIGIQLLAGSLTTAISALVTGREITIVLPILGAISTLTAAFLTRARGSNGPEQSLMVARDLEQFIRECKAFLVDFGSDTDKRGTEAEE